MIHSQQTLCGTSLHLLADELKRPPLCDGRPNTRLSFLGLTTPMLRRRAAKNCPLV